MSEQSIAVVGAGRMGRGIALSYAYAGQATLLIDLKARTEEGYAELEASARTELAADLAFLEKLDLIKHEHVQAVLDKVSFAHPGTEAIASLKDYPIIYEGVPEVMEAKAEAFAFLSEHAAADAIVASTTSTFLVTELAELISEPQRFLNAHWLNPAHLMPLVEISRADSTSQSTLDTLVASLEGIGKETVVCSATAGYIVPRIQSLAMNEAARLVEEGVASAEDVDKAVNFGFGPRFAVLGLLEFIDWGGGDILYYASEYLAKTLDKRYGVPDIVVKNMREGKNGIRDGEGFFNYRNMDTAAYRERRLGEFVALLKYRDLLPVHKVDDAGE